MSKDLRIDLKVEDKATKPIDTIKKGFEGLNKSVVKTDKSITNIESSFDTVKKSAGTMFSAAAVGFAGVAAVVGVAGKAVYELGQEILSTIAKEKQLNKLQTSLKNNSAAFEEMRGFAGEAGISIEQLIERGAALANSYQPGRAVSYFKTLADLQAKGVLTTEKFGQAQEFFVEMAAKATVGLSDYERAVKTFGSDLSIERMSKVSGKSIKELQKSFKDGTADIDILLNSIQSLSGLPPGELAKKFALGDLDSQITNIETTLANFKTNFFKALFGEKYENNAAEYLAKFNSELKKLTSVESLDSFLTKMERLKPIADVLYDVSRLVLTPVIAPLTDLVKLMGWLYDLAPDYETWAIFADMLKVWKQDLVVAKDSVKLWFSELGTKLKEYGSNIIDGLWSGITNSWAKLLEKFKAITEQLPESMKKILGIHSPSKVFADIGKNMMLGLHNSIKKNSNPILKSLETLSNKSIDTFANTGSAINSRFGKVEWAMNDSGTNSDVETVNQLAAYTPPSKQASSTSNSSTVNNFTIPIKINIGAGTTPDKSLGPDIKRAVKEAVYEAFYKEKKYPLPQ